MKWFSASVRAVVLAEGVGTIDGRDSVFTFRARDYEDAFPRAISLARSALETDYTNVEGQRVRWRVTRVLTLDEIRHVDLDGAEVWAQGSDPAPDELFAFDHAFTPEGSPPENSGV